MLNLSGELPSAISLPPRRVVGLDFAGAMIQGAQVQGRFIINPLSILCHHTIKLQLFAAMLATRSHALSHPRTDTKSHSFADVNPEKSTAAPLLAELAAHHIVVLNESSSKQQIIRQRDSVFLNNSNPHNPASQILVRFMQERNLKFTGTNTKFYEVGRDQILTAAACSGILVPASRDVFQLQELENGGLELPLMVKPNWQVSCNIGGQENYLVHNTDALKIMTQTMLDQCGAATLEQYVPGRQLACLCYNTGSNIRALKPVEFSFSQNGPQYITQQLKNDPIRQQWYEPCEEEVLAERVRKSVESFFRVLMLSGQFLFTIRVNQSKLFLINFKPVTLPLHHNVRPLKTSSLLENILFSNNLTKKQFLETMVQGATLRQAKNRKNFAIRTNPEKCMPVLYATRDIEAEQLVYEQESARENIIIIDWIKNHYDEISWGNLWSRKSQGWKPISHSCAPNSQVLLDGVKAIRKITAGQEITVDFATIFYHDLTFQCSCGAANCRKVISLKNQHEQWFKEIPSSQFHPWMMDLTFKQTLVRMLNDKHDIIKLEYEPGNCYAVAKRNILPGERVVPLDELPVHPYNTRHSITKNGNEYWDTTTSYGQFLNHKCSNYNLKINEDSTAMIAASPISKDKMLSFNYLTTEWDVCFPFTCLCGEAKCHRLVKGFKEMPKQSQEEIHSIGHCSQYVNQQFSSLNII